MENNRAIGRVARRIEMSMRCFHQLRDLIYGRSGIFFPENKKYLLESRLLPRLTELEINSFEAYVDYVNRGIGKDQELTKIFNSVTINETYFFRFKNQLQVFSEKLLPEVLQKKMKEGGKPLRIWSAGCSSGEEVYTIAMLLMEHLNGRFSLNRVELVGTDISQKILTKARSGAYSRNSFRGSMNPNFRRKYFSDNGHFSTIAEGVKKLVRFDYLNLNDTHRIRMLRGVDFLFCRNVLIYFDEEMKRKVVRSFYDILNHGGYLFLGEAESIHGISSSFKVEHFPGAFVYKKE